MQLNSKLVCHLAEIQDFKRNALYQAGMETQNLRGFHNWMIWQENKWKDSEAEV